jgi:hypothetical protein
MNITIQEMVKAMLDESEVPKTFWGEVVQTIVNILNKAHIRVNSDKTPYELWHGISTSIKNLKKFGSKCYIKINEDNLGKFNSRYDEGMILGYSSRSKGYKCYNKRLHKIIESIDVKVHEKPFHLMRHQDPRRIQRRLRTTQNLQRQLNMLRMDSADSKREKKKEVPKTQ